MNWQKLKCAVFGHKWKVVADNTLQDVAGEFNCECGAQIPSINWPKTSAQWDQAIKTRHLSPPIPYALPKPTGPAPPMPAMRGFGRRARSVRSNDIGRRRIADGGAGTVLTSR